jgi:hypothetical protein
MVCPAIEATLTIAQVWQREAGEHDGGDEVHLDDAAQLFGVEVLDRAAGVLPGVVDQDVDAPEGVDDGAEHGGAGVRVAHVGGERPRRALPDLGGQRFERLRAARDQRHLGPFGREQAGGGCADTARGARNDDDLAQKSLFHLLVSPAHLVDAGRP